MVIVLCCVWSAAFSSFRYSETAEQKLLFNQIFDIAVTVKNSRDIFTGSVWWHADGIHRTKLAGKFLPHSIIQRIPIRSLNVY